MFLELRLQLLLLSSAVLLGVFVGYMFYLFSLSYYGQLGQIYSVL